MELKKVLSRFGDRRHEIAGVFLSTRWHYDLGWGEGFSANIYPKSLVFELMNLRRNRTASRAMLSLSASPTEAEHP